MMGPSEWFEAWTEYDITRHLGWLRFARLESVEPLVAKGLSRIYGPGPRGVDEVQDPGHSYANVGAVIADRENRALASGTRAGRLGRPRVAERVHAAEAGERTRGPSVGIVMLGVWRPSG